MYSFLFSYLENRSNNLREPSLDGDGAQSREGGSAAGPMSTCPFSFFRLPSRHQERLNINFATGWRIVLFFYCLDLIISFKYLFLSGYISFCFHRCGGLPPNVHPMFPVFDSIFAVWNPTGWSQNKPEPVFQCVWFSIILLPEPPTEKQNKKNTKTKRYTDLELYILKKNRGGKWFDKMK